MSVLNNGTLQCDWCRKFSSWDDSDSYTIFGAVYSSLDGSPEPHEPVELCKKCSENLYKDFLKDFKNGKRSGDWMKSGAEVKAAKESGLVWVGNSTLVNKKTGHKAFNCYVEQIEIEFYEPKFRKIDNLV